jgi:hypothetical protein
LLKTFSGFHQLCAGALVAENINPQAASDTQTRDMRDMAPFLSRDHTDHSIGPTNIARPDEKIVIATVVPNWAGNRHAYMVNKSKYV